MQLRIGMFKEYVEDKESPFFPEGTLYILYDDRFPLNKERGRAFIERHQLDGVIGDNPVHAGLFSRLTNVYILGYDNPLILEKGQPNFFNPKGEVDL